MAHTNAGPPLGVSVGLVTAAGFAAVVGLMAGQTTTAGPTELVIEVPVAAAPQLAPSPALPIARPVEHSEGAPRGSETDVALPPALADARAALVRAAADPASATAGASVALTAPAAPAATVRAPDPVPAPASTPAPTPTPAPVPPPASAPQTVVLEATPVPAPVTRSAENVVQVSGSTNDATTRAS